jgi:3'-phosphoadenosine 5'-phosphosulfate sulfotransferase (PAPS reductase)/FAD synthetase
MIKETTEIPVILIQTLTIRGYFRVFYLILQETELNHREAYEFLEELREKYGFPRHYENYSNFRSAKARMLCEYGFMLTNHANNDSK